ERFHRVEGVEGRSHEGSGIGLALVHELVKLHGGELSVASTRGAGSTFTVAIPLGAGHLSADQIVPAAAAPGLHAAKAYAEEALRWLPVSQASGQPPATDGMRAAVGSSAPHLDVGHILVADDNADMRDYARRLLSQRWTVDAVSKGREALAAARLQ